MRVSRDIDSYKEMREGAREASKFELKSSPTAPVSAAEVDRAYEAGLQATAEVVMDVNNKKACCRAQLCCP